MVITLEGRCWTQLYFSLLSGYMGFGAGGIPRLAYEEDDLTS